MAQRSLTVQSESQPSGTLADATSLKAALGVVPIALVLAAAALTLVRRASSAPATAIATG